MLLALHVLTILTLYVAPTALGSINSPGKKIFLRTGTLLTAPRQAVESDSMPRYAIVQLRGPIHESDKAELRRCGAEPLVYIPEDAFIARVAPEKAAQLSKLPSVFWIGPYKPEYKLSPALPNSDAHGKAYVKLFAGESEVAVESAARARGLSVQKASGGLLRVQGAFSVIKELAELPEVEWIEPVPEARFFNDRAREITGVHTAWQNHGLYGTGQVVAVTDTGLSTGNIETLHPDLRGRVRIAIGLTPSGDWTDDYGHGTHVAGTIAGSGAASGAEPEARMYQNSFAGVAPEAELVIQAVKIDPLFGSPIGLPDNLNDLFFQSYVFGARIHNNSWGDIDVPYGEYNLHAAQVDEFVWNHPDMLVVFAAGNEAERMKPDVDEKGTEETAGTSIVAPGTAKNCLSVGATENYRPPSENWKGYSHLTWSVFGFANEPEASDYISDNPNGLAAFSGRGPAFDGRVKPDLVAPGTDIISTISSAAPLSHYWDVQDEHYAYLGGTSMACAVVSGAAALVREFLEKRGMSTGPSSALLRAVLAAGAEDISPGQYGAGEKQEIHPRPDFAQGWGRLNLDSLFRRSPNGAGLQTLDETVGLETGEIRRYSVYVSPNTERLVLALAWSDYPGAPEAGRALVNDLDLIVYTPTGERLLGNGRTDRLNNLELVEIKLPRRGMYTATVAARNVPFGPQPFALAVLGSPGPISVFGDLDNNGRTELSDVVLGLRVVTGTAFIKGRQKLEGEVTTAEALAETITLADVVRTLRAFLGLNPWSDEELPA
jgi:subtilisin family serine protease